MLALLTLSTAFAASNEIGLELGWLAAPDPRWNTFASADVYGTGGVRIGYAVHDRVAVIAGWQHGNVGSSLESGYDYAYEDEDDEEIYYSDSSLRTAFYGAQLTLGAKADLEIWRWFAPYATVQAVGLRALVRLDDDPGDDANLTQVQRAGVTGGFLTTAGLQFPIHFGERLAIAPYTELGYGWLAPVVFKDVGAVKLDGFAGRFGVALHF